MKPFFLKVDALDFSLDVTLSQYGSGEQLHLVGFHSKEFLLAVINYEIHDKILLVIINAFKERWHLLEGVQNTFTIYIDQQNLEYFMNALKY